MSITVTIAGSSYTYSETLETDWGDQNTSVIQAICSNAIWTNAIVDNLTSTDATKVLSAKQGKELEDTKATTNDTISVSDLDTTPASDANTTVTSKWAYDNLYNPSYDSGWFVLGDYTNASQSISHNLGTAFDDISYRILWSVSGVDGNDNIDVTNFSDYDSVASKYYGQWCNGTATSNTIFLRTMRDGGLYVDSSGVRQAITSGSYRVIVRKNIFK